MFFPVRARAMSRARGTARLHCEVTDPQRSGYFDAALTFRVNTRSPLPEFVSVARTGMEVRGLGGQRLRPAASLLSRLLPPPGQAGCLQRAAQDV